MQVAKQFLTMPRSYEQELPLPIASWSDRVSPPRRHFDADLFRALQRRLTNVLRMTHRSRSLMEWVLVRAWIEPDHHDPLRVVIKRVGGDAGEPEPEQAFADAEGAAAFVRLWLTGLMRRWEAGERSGPPLRHRTRDADDDDQPGDEREN